MTNGFYWEGVDGYRGSYLTAIRNGDYGVYAFDSVNGQFDHSYASGSPDSGFYIGQCFPCNALITDVEAEWNGLGYSGTNAGGNLVIASSTWHDNRVGIAPNSLTTEELAPQRIATFVGNHVYDNVNEAAAGIEIARIAGGTGIVVGGGQRNKILRNLVTGNTVGIGLIPLPEKLLEPNRPGAKNFDARNNTVRFNVAQGNTYDLAVATSVEDPTDGGGNCFSDNDATTTVPVDLQAKLPCGSPPSGFEADTALAERAVPLREAGLAALQRRRAARSAIAGEHASRADRAGATGDVGAEHPRQRAHDHDPDGLSEGSWRARCRPAPSQRARAAQEAPRLRDRVRRRGSDRAHGSCSSCGSTACPPIGRCGRKTARCSSQARSRAGRCSRRSRATSSSSRA